MTKRRPTAEQRAECLRLYGEGVMLKHLCDRYDVHRVTINRWVAGAGIQRGQSFKGKWKVLDAHPS